MINSKKVIAVSRLFQPDMPKVIRTGVNTVRISQQAEWEKIPIQVPAALTISSKEDKKQTIYTAKLVFRFCGDFYHHGIFVYKVTLANGEELLLGSHERPYTTCSAVRQSSPSDGNSELTEVTVEYKSSKEIATIR